MTVDPCVECGLSTELGSGRFINRLGWDDGEKDGWMCPECLETECEMCGELSINYSGYEGMIVCDDCYPDEEEA